MDFDGIAFPELGVAPLIASGTDLDDELPTSDDSLVEPEIRPVQQGGFDLELAKALLDVLIMPSMITPIDDPGVDSRVSPATYPVPPIPVVLVDEPVYLLEAPPVREVVSSPVRECSPSPPRMAPMLRDAPFGGGGGESSDSPCLPRPLTPWLLEEVAMVESTEDSTPGEPMAVCAPCEPDLSREGPFDVYQHSSESGTSPRVLDSLPGCQYRMTSYDEANSRPDMSPAYRIHLHDPQLLEYVSAPVSARLSRTPEYWLHHMGRERTLAAVLQLQHDAGLILSNIQVLGGHARGI